MALMMGYTDIHFFGFDSCMTMENAHHAYEFTDPTKSFWGTFTMSGSVWGK